MFVTITRTSQAVQVLSPIAAAWPTRLSRLVILCALLSASVSPVPTDEHAAAGATGTSTSGTVTSGMVTSGMVTMRTWDWPVPVPHAIVRPYVAPATAYAAGHRGIDISSAAESAVTAPADGQVYFSGVVVDRPVLSIRHADGLVSSYEPVESALPAGTVVRRGDTVGSLLAGHCATACLHFGVRLYGQYVSPLNYLGGIARSILLPTRPLP